MRYHWPERHTQQLDWLVHDGTTGTHTLATTVRTKKNHHTADYIRNPVGITCDYGVIYVK